MTGKESFAKGAFCATFGGILWAVSGACGQVLFQSCHFDAQWLTVTRLLCAGSFFLIYGFIKNGKGMLTIWKDKKDTKDLILYAIFGLVGIQFTYFMAIELSNAATATVIQYMGPAMILVYLAIRTKTPPTKIEVLAVCLAIGGIFLLATHGNPNTLQITPIALFWAVASAVTMAIQSIQPRQLLAKFGTPVCNGWGMIVGGLAFCLIRPPWEIGDGVWSVKAIIVLCGVVVLGTILSFFFYMEGVRIIGAGKASLYACSEPLSSAIISVCFLNVAFGWIDWVGSAMIISTIFLTSMQKKSEPVLNDTKEILKTDQEA